MGVVLLIALWLLAIVVLVAGAALLLPLRLELAVEKEAEWRVVAAIRPFGRFGPRIPFKRDTARRKPEARRKEKKHKKRRTSWGDPRSLLPAVLSLFTDILGRIRVGKLTVDAQIGFGDPALTGQTFGMLCPLMYGSGAIPGIEMRIAPDFNRPVLRGAADMAFSIVPIMLLGPILRFAIHFFRVAR